MTLSPTNQQRALIALVQVLGLSVWFSATAVVPSLRSEWGIGSTAAVWLTASVQIGFVAGAVISALSNLADRIRPQYLLTASALVPDAWEILDHLLPAFEDLHEAAMGSRGD